MTDLKSYFSRTWQTNEGWRADCPRCDDRQHRFYWNEEKQVGCCFHASCAWFYQRGGATLKRVSAYFSTDGLVVPDRHEIIPSPENAEIKLPKEFKRIRDCGRELKNTLYAYMQSRGISRRVTDAAQVGYCDSGKWWGYLIFPVLNDESEVIYWQARRFKNREPKFYNPAASYKSELVYRLSGVRPKKIVIVESIFNALTLENASIGGIMVMALLGKTISPIQIQSVLRFEKRLREIVIALDGDARRDAVEIAGKFWAAAPGIVVRVASIPEGHDINSLGREASYDRIRHARLYDADSKIGMMVGGA